MSRIRASLYVFCLEKASEALRNAEMADTHRDYEYWCGLEAKCEAAQGQPANARFGHISVWRLHRKRFAERSP